MAYNARVFRILIASPSDVIEERNQISKVIQEWNDLHSYDRKVVLLPLKWETHSSPELGSRPQDIINREVVDYCDMAIGVFWTRIGSPTGTHQSGTIEEIERVGKSGKIVMLYFSKAKIEPDSIDLEQYQSLKEFKKSNYPNGLIEIYSDIVDFRDKLAKQLEIKLRSLIASDTEDSVSISDVNKPKFEINLVDTDLNSVIENKSTFTIELSELINLDKVPDYEESDDKDEIILRRIRGGKDYYRNILTSLIVEENSKVFALNLNNLGPISIRDIFCELKVMRDKTFYLGTRGYQSRYLIDIDRLPRLLRSKYRYRRYNDENLIPISETNDHYSMNFKYPALQPQRNITLPNSFIYQNLGQKVLKLEITTYADCFAQPLISQLEININRKITKIDALTMLEELNLKK